MTEHARSVSKRGSEQESVRPPGFIGFPGFGADGLTKFHGPGSESSPMFTDLLALACIDRRRRRKSPVSVHADDCHGPTHQRTQARAAAQRANSIGWCDGLHGALRKAKPPRRYRQIRSYSLASVRTIREFQYSRLSETALLSAGSCLRSAVQGRNPRASNPRKGKSLKSPPIGGFSNSRAEPQSLTYRNE